MRPWISRRRPPSIRPQHGRCPTRYRRSTIRIASRYATSAPMAASAGTRTGSTSPSSVPASTSAWRKLTRASGTSTSACSSSDACMNATCVSRMHMADSSVTRCNPCPRTILLPLSPTGQINQRYYRATDSISLAGIGKMPELPTPLLPCLGSMVHALPVNHRSTTIFSCSPSNGLSR